MSVTNPCPHPLGHEDAAMRLADNVNLHFAAIGWDAVGKWVACRLDDGTSDGVLYDKRQEAVRHQHHNEQFYCFVKIVPGSMGYCEAQVYLDFHRKAYTAGFRLADPEAPQGGRSLIVRGRPMETVHQMMRQFGNQRRH